MLIPASNPSKQAEVAKKARECLECSIKQMCEEKTLLLSEINEKMLSMLVKMVREVWEKYCSDRYGWNPLKKYKYFHVSTKINKGETQLIMQKTNVSDFSNRVKSFLNKPQIATQPIIYKHNIPRSTQELLYFDSPSSLFYFSGARGYSLLPDKMFNIVVGRGTITHSATDGRRIMVGDGNEKKKVYRDGVVCKEALPPYLCDKFDHANISIVDYNSFADEKLVETLSVLEKYMQLMPIYKDDDCENGYLSECLSYLPYLMTALLISVESDCLKMAQSVDKYCTRREWKKSMVSSFFITKQSLANSISPAHLHYLSLWADYLKDNAEVLAEEYGLGKSVSCCWSSISKADNLNLLVSNIQSEQVCLNLLEYLYCTLDPFKRKRTALYFEDCQENEHPCCVMADFHTKLCRIMSPEYYTLYIPPLEDWADGQIQIMPQNQAIPLDFAALFVSAHPPICPIKSFGYSFLMLLYSPATVCRF